MSATARRGRDPILGVRWFVDCDWHGATGRYHSRAEAEAAANRYHVDCGPDALERRIWGDPETADSVWVWTP